ncbi:glycoside hydrolase family 13 protein [Candidatus Allofournierella excrementavium]|uniref:glycoside hydrolase family 13 protein n=1 Tax=Candidatus Allofournierella excrementavium TaxID=2838591 RepID=UPI003AF5A229
MDHLFNSLDSAYKTPRGAVRTGEPLRLALTIPEHYGFVEPRLVLTKDGGDPVEYRMDFKGCVEGVNHFRLSLTLDEVGLYFYYFDLYSDFRKLYRGELGEAVLSWTAGACWQLTVYEADFATPKALRGGVMYQIFPDRFFEGRPHPVMPFADRVYRANKQGEPYFWPNEQGGQLNLDYFGGDFEGIRKKLGYLQELGVTWIYLNPIFEAHANHRYNTADYLNADPLLGTNEEFTLLCREAKEKGIRIILDGVFSHTGSDSLYFNREGRYGQGGAYHDPNSPYRSWYDFDQKYPCGYRSWWGFETLPEVREDDPAYQQFICGKGGVIDTWLSRGASGFRLDVADELPDDFIESIRKAVKAHGPDCYLLGEVWEDATTKEAYGVRRTYLLGKGLDGVMNYPFRNAILSFLRGGSALSSAEQLTAICEHYPAPALHALMNHLGTHDTERILTALEDEPAEGRDRYWQSGRRLPKPKYDHGIRLVRLAYAMLFTLPGVPCIYYGDEVGMQGYRDPFNRAYYDWDSTENRIKPLLRQLAKLRKECDAFWEGDFRVTRADGGLLQYRRTGPTETAEIVVNRTPRLLATRALGKVTEVNPFSFTVVVEDTAKLAAAETAL